MAPPEKEKGAPDERTPSNRFESFYDAGDTPNGDAAQAQIKRIEVHVRHPHTGEMVVGDMNLEDCLAMTWEGEA